jgi:DNA helicase-2/ATP-dependent DNA helicase PcrA
MREHRVVGPPGTGKTTYLQRQFANAVQSGAYGAADLFACSLTRAAATELASRVDGVPDRNVGTLHSHAYRALKYPGIVETTAGLKEWNEHCGANAYRIGTQHAANPENAPAEPPGADTDGVRLLQAMGVLRQRMVPRELWPIGVRAFAKKWDEFKTESNRVDFTDLIEVALDSIDALPGCRVLFVDEAQDMSKLEFALARKWGERADELVIVGDPDQNLYEWRGSDPAAFYATEATTERVLEQSYRVPQEVHKMAQQWIRQIPDRKDAAYLPRDEGGTLTRSSWIWKDPEPLINAVGEGMRAKEDETWMVLAACGYMLQPLCAALRDDGLLFHNPYRSGFHPWNPLRSSARLLAFLRPSKEVWGSEARMWTWQDVHQWGSVLKSSGVFTRGFKSVIESRLGQDRFGDSDADKTIPMAKLLDGLANDEVRERVLGMDIEWWADHLLHSNRQASHYAMGVARRHGANQLVQKPRLVVGTIHSVKGGEADNVILFPDLSSAGYYGSWKTSKSSKWSVVRQFYVGMTRARRTLTLCAPSSEMAVQWLAHQ